MQTLRLVWGLCEKDRRGGGALREGRWRGRNRAEVSKRGGGVKAGRRCQSGAEVSKRRCQSGAEVSKRGGGVKAGR
eukprot:1177652-Prorocentrum_minimum.AAC.4